MKEFGDKLVEDFLKWWDKWNNKRRERASARAAEADRKANEATSAAEAEKYRAVAEVWRQVAEEQRLENERLREELSRVTREAKEAAGGDVDKMRQELQRALPPGSSSME